MAMRIVFICIAIFFRHKTIAPNNDDYAKDAWQSD